MSLYKFTHIKNETNQNKKVANNQPKKKKKDNHPNLWKNKNHA